MAKNKKPYNGRDNLKLALIKGATKANIAIDKKKEKNKKECRSKEESYYDDLRELDVLRGKANFN